MSVFLLLLRYLALFSLSFSFFVSVSYGAILPTTDVDSGEFGDDYEELRQHYEEYKDMIPRYLERCAELLDQGLECCGYDELVALFSRRIDARCLHPWTTYTGCNGGFYSPALTGAAAQTGEKFIEGEPTLHGFNRTRKENEARVCPAGYFCPTDFLCVVPCSEGAYCPQGVLRELDRPPDEALSVTAACRVNASFCCAPYGDPQYLGKCGGAKTDYPCESGHYCPDTVTQLPCPDGFFCRAGSITPHTCPPMTKCPEGTSVPVNNYIAVITFATVFALIFIAYYTYRHREFIMEVYRWVSWHSKRTGSRLSGGGRGKDGEERLLASFITSPEEASGTNQVPLMDMEMGGVGDSDAGAPPDHDRGLDVDGEGRVIDPRADAPMTAVIPEKSLKLEISFEGLGLELFSSGKKVLSGVTGTVSPHRLVAVMGPSGAGKSTFLSALSGKAAAYGEVFGDITVNGERVPLDTFRPLFGFVPQEDVMHRSLCAREILSAQAALRLPRSVCAAERSSRVESVIELLDLAHVAHLEIGTEEKRGISGGQRKRVNIGMELVADPTVLFLDEPTSGLDSTSSYEVVRALKEIAEAAGMTIMAVIHQPRYEIFTLFHDVLLLAPGGKTVYLGPSNKCVEWFESLGFKLPAFVNPPDFFLDAISGKSFNGISYTSEALVKEWEARGAEFVRNAKKSEGNDNNNNDDDDDDNNNNNNDDESDDESDDENNNDESDDDDDGERISKDQKGGGDSGALLPSQYVPPARPPFFKQVYVHFYRSTLLQVRRRREIIFDLFLNVVAGAFLGAIYSRIEIDRLMGLTAMASLALGLLSMTSSLAFFSGPDRTAFFREASSGISKAAFFTGTMLSHIPLIVFQPLLFMSFLYTLASPRTRLISFFEVCFATTFACTGMGYFVSVISKNSQMICVVLALICSMLSGGNPTLNGLNDIPFFGPLGYTLSYAKWFSEALFKVEAAEYTQVMWPMVEGLRRHIGYNGAGASYVFSKCIGILWAIGFVFRFLSFFSMVVIHRAKMK